MKSPISDKIKSGGIKKVNMLGWDGAKIQPDGSIKHFYDNEPPFKIITGNSSKMKEKVLKYLDNNNHK